MSATAPFGLPITRLRPSHPITVQETGCGAHSKGVKVQEAGCGARVTLQRCRKQGGGGRYQE